MSLSLAAAFCSLFDDNVVISQQYKEQSSTNIRLTRTTSPGCQAAHTADFHDITRIAKPSSQNNGHSSTALLRADWLRGVAPQSVPMAFLLCAANLRKIEVFVAEAEAEASGSMRRLPSRRTSKSIEEYLPKATSTDIDTAGAGSPPGPDPPLIA
jgi:hypothetical protein